MYFELGIFIGFAPVRQQVIAKSKMTNYLFRISLKNMNMKCGPPNDFSAAKVSSTADAILAQRLIKQVAHLTRIVVDLTNFPNFDHYIDNRLRNDIGYRRTSDMVYCDNILAYRLR
jgi:hypothetical protein